ncbi:MAG: hypothetical protein WCA79_16210 [Anaerolineales bacterium]
MLSAIWGTGLESDEENSSVPKNIAAPAINTFLGPTTTEIWKIADQLDLASALVDKLPSEIKTSDRTLSQGNFLSEPEHSGILALHRFLKRRRPHVG